MISQAELKTLIFYDPIEGKFYWKVSRPNGIKPGDIAGSIRTDGYYRIKLNGKAYKANRIAWLYMKGNPIPRIVDHEDRNKLNDKWENLRGANDQQSVVNRVFSKDTQTGERGVWFNPKYNGPKKWVAHICINYKKKTLGRFETKEAAVRAYRIAAVAAFGEFLPAP